MLWGHCIQYCCNGSFDFFNDSVYRFIYSFHMPLLMLISGYLFYFSSNKRNLNDLIDHKIKSILYPIIVCSILFSLITNTLMNILNGNIKAILSIDWFGYLTYYWFLWSVMICSIPIAFASKVKNMYVRLIIYFVGALLVFIAPCGANNLWMYPYYVLGFIYAKYKDFNFMISLKKIKLLSLIVFPIMLLFFTKDHFFYTTGLTGNIGFIGNMPTNLYRWAIGLIGSVFIFTLLDIFLSISTLKNPIISFLNKLGENSMQYYVLQCILISFYLPIICSKFALYIDNNLFINNTLVYDYLITLPLAVIFSVMIDLLIKFLYKANIGKIIFGR